VLEDLTRTRVDYRQTADGRWKAIVTVTLPQGVVRRFEATADPEDFEDAAPEVSGPIQMMKVVQNYKRGKYKSKAEFAAALKKAKKAGGGGLLSGVGKAFKSLGKGVVSVAEVVKDVATSKAFLMAAGGLATAIPGLGPVVGPAAMAAAATMGTAGKLIAASRAAKSGSKAIAAALTKEASAGAAKLTKTPQGARALLELANKKRKGAEALAAGKKPSKAPSKPPAPSSRRLAPAPVPKRLPPPASTTPVRRADGEAVLAAARAGKLRSNKPGPITPAALLEAHKAGRVFWLN